jgi:MoaA/NifB/PqqE/SkfB family radical SAM enzyme
MRCKLRRYPRLVNLEFTKRCNAKCSFCGCWQTESPDELDDYSPIIKKFRPVLVSVSGGEPLLRKNYDKLLSGIRPYCHYLSVITNGALLNEESAGRLAAAGVDQISVSLDYLSERHDEARMIKGLYGHISETVPALIKKGFRISLNTVIMESNLDEILSIAHRASEWGAEISFSAYCTLKSDGADGMVGKHRNGQLGHVIEEVIRLKGRLGNIKNSDYYLSRIPHYFRDGFMANCKAGYNWVQVTPDGYVQQCSELPRLFHYAEYDAARIRRSACTKCWYTCRGELEANPLAPKRLWELIKT